MGNNGRNLRQRSTTEISCRLCSQTFTSNETLIAHIDSHVAQEEIALKSLHHDQHHQNTPRREVFHNHLPPNIPRAIRPGQARNFPSTRAFWAPPQSTVMPPQPTVVHPQRRNPNSLNSSKASASPSVQHIQSPPQVFSSTRNNKAVTTQQWNNIEEPKSEGTKPFIKMLEKPIRRIEFIDLVNVDDDESGLQKLDLTLKL